MRFVTARLLFRHTLLFLLFRHEGNYGMMNILSGLRIEEASLAENN